MKRLLLACACLAAGLRGATLEIPEDDAKAMALSAARLAKLLAEGKPVSLPLGEISPRGADQAWTAEGLEAVLGSTGPLSLDALPEAAHAFKRSGACRVLLIENKSSLKPLSQALPGWSWPFQAAEFAEVEKAPKVWLDASTYDAVFFSSPGWWDNFATPPSGPSRMTGPVAEAVRAYVKAGGSAVFLDLAQWDLEKCWPRSLRLASLGPWELDKFKALGSQSGGKLSLAEEGVVADKLYPKTRAVLVQQSAFHYPDGEQGPAYAAYAFADPSGGSGIVAGFAFDVFEQDESLAGRAKRIFLNLLLASGASRTGATAVPAAELPSPRPSPTREDTPAPPTSTPTLTEAPTPLPTLAPTQPPTAAPTPLPPTPLPTLVPTQAATAVPTAEPTRAAPATLPPTAQPTATSAPTLAPAPAPSPLPTLAPSKAPPAEPTRVPSPKPRAVLPPPLVVAPGPAPARPKRAAARPAKSPSPAPTFVPVRVRDAIGCIQSAPEPFSEGGVYVFYCLKHAATVTFKVFNAKGKLVFSEEPQFQVPGSHQQFYGGVNLKGQLIKPGRYQYRLEAVYDEHSSEWRQSEFTLKPKRR